MNTLQIPFKPWESFERESWVTTRPNVYGNQYRIKTIFKTLTNFDRSIWKLGDIVKFGNGFRDWPIHEAWQNWFLKDDAREKWIEDNCEKHPGIPKYARNNYAILIGRYKLIKDKGYAKFSDYGSYIMMLTGYAAGRTRKYYTTSPYDTIGHFPYTTMKYNLNAKKLFNGVSTNSTVETFLERLVEKFNGYRRGC